MSNFQTLCNINSKNFAPPVNLFECAHDQKHKPLNLGEWIDLEIFWKNFIILFFFIIFSIRNHRRDEINYNGSRFNQKFIYYSKNFEFIRNHPPQTLKLFTTGLPYLTTGCSAPWTSTLTWRTFPASSSTKSFSIQPAGVSTAARSIHVNWPKKLSPNFHPMFFSSGQSTDPLNVLQQDR